MPRRGGPVVRGRGADPCVPPSIFETSHEISGRTECFVTGLREMERTTEAHRCRERRALSLHHTPRSVGAISWARISMPTLTALADRPTSRRVASCYEVFAERDLSESRLHRAVRRTDSEAEVVARLAGVVPHVVVHGHGLASDLDGGRIVADDADDFDRAIAGFERTVGKPVARPPRSDH